MSCFFSNSMERSWKMWPIKDVSLTSHNRPELLILCSETLKMKKTGESPLLQDRFGKTMYVKYGVLYNGISGNMWFEVLYSLFPLIFISHLIISVFTEKKDNRLKQINTWFSLWAGFTTGTSTILNSFAANSYQPYIKKKTGQILTFWFITRCSENRGRPDK